MKLIKSLLSKALQKQNGSWKYKLLTQWDSIVGELKNQITLTKIEKSKLTISVKDPHWIPTLHLMSHSLITKINSALHGNYITNIHFIHKYKTKNKNIQQKQNLPASANELNNKILSSEQTRALEKIKDKSLREHLTKLYYQLKK